MNEDMVKKTQNSLGKIIGKKPPLTEKLLNRPPFRFLHDIITSVIRQTGFMKGLFTDKEASAENISSKEEKVAFLQKAIDITVHAAGTKLSVKPSKVVAGLEAERTNEFLQALAAAVEKKPDNEACVKKVLSGSGGGEPSSRSSRDSKSNDKDVNDNEREQSADKRKRRSERGEKPTSKSSSSRKDKENRDGSDRKERDSTDRRERDGSGRKERGSSDRKDREGSDRKEKDGSDRDRKDREGSDRKEKDGSDRDRKDRDRKHRDSSKDGKRDSSRPRESSRDRKDKEPSDRRDDKRERSGRHRRKEEDKPQVNGSQEEPPAKESSEAPSSRPTDESTPEQDPRETSEEPTINRIPRPSSAKGSRRRHRDGRRQAPDLDDDENGPSGKFGGSSNNMEEDSVIPPQVEQSRKLARPSSARPAPPRVKRQDNVQESLTERVDSARTQRVENVIIDDAQHSEDDDDDNFMVADGIQEPLVSEREETVAPVSEEDGQHGGLVKKILDSKKEYAQSEQQQQQKSQTKTKIDKSSVNDATRHKEKEMVKKEVEKLRASIQTLTRSANPLGKIMDYVQEDLHSMQKERDMWRAENRKLADQIKREMGVTDSSIEPLKVTLSELEQGVSDQLDLIAAVKHSIIDNDEKITKMLSSVSRT